MLLSHIQLKWSYEVGMNETNTSIQLAGKIIKYYLY